MALSRGPNAPPGTPGGRSAQVEMPQPGQTKRWSRYSSTTGRTGGTSAFDINYATVDATATVADGDYVANSGKLHVGVGVNTQTVSVRINGDQG